MKRKILACLIAAEIIIVTTIMPTKVSADGGPMVDPLLFAKLKEGQQVAVIRLRDASTSSVDLFVSILDQTGESHEVTYFVPLGIEPIEFQVNEEDSLTFGNSQTADLDRIIFQDYRQDRQYLQNLFAGALLTNGVWLTPLWLPMLLSGCSAPAAPLSSFTTESSQVDVFSIDETTDIEALISTTGLDASVKDTLSRLEGQQIAIIKINTSPLLESSGPSETELSDGEPGLHLSWVTSLTANKHGSTYAYPLGTGASWANPIEMTRVYVIAPLDLNFNVQYPKLGPNRSGFVQNEWRFEPRIMDFVDAPAYAVDDAIGQWVYYPTSSAGYYQSMRVWRATYTNSNSAEDILITVSANRGMGLRTFLRQQGPEVALIVGLIVAVLFWMLAWYFLVPRLVGRNFSAPGLWRISLTYIAWNLLLFLPGGILYLFFSFGVRVMPLVFAVILFGGASVLIFSIRHLDKLTKVSGKAIQIFAVVIGASGGAYLLFALCYAWLVGAI
jgi:hypothetical protein